MDGSEEHTPEELRRRSHDSVQRWVAAAVGAAEGVIEGLRRERLGEKTGEAMHETASLVRGTTEEFRHQAQTPEGRRIGQGVRQVGHQTTEMVHQVGDKAQETKQSLTEQATILREDAMQRYESGKKLVVERVDDARAMVQEARDKVVEVKDHTKARAQSVAEAGRRAKEAPAVMVRDVREAARSYVGGVKSSIAYYSLAGVVAAAAFIVFTVALVSGINVWLGVPWGAFITAGLYGAGAIGLVAWAKAKKAESKEEVEERVEHIRQEARYVARPVKEAFAHEAPAPRVTP